jgi:hypothetical protein
MSDEPKEVTRAALEATLWQQGSLLPSSVATPPILWAHPTSQGVKAARSAIKAEARQREVTVPLVAQRQFRQGEQLVVISQTCDILKPPDQLPQVEAALATTTSNSAVITDALDLGSARFRLMREHADGTALVLDYAWRTFLDKGFLLECEPDNSIVDSFSDGARKTLARWLARRYGRPVLSDKDVAEVADPVRDRWKQLRDEEPDLARRYTEAFPEFRFRREPEGGLTLFILSTDPNPDPTLALEVIGLLTGVLEPIHGTVTVDTAKRSYHTFTKADELSTEQLDLEWASYEEGEPLGALPAE